MREEIISLVQKILQSLKLDGWLIYDFQKRNSLAMQFLGFDNKAHLTRRFFYWIPREGSPIKIVHKIESFHLDHWPGEKREYFSFQSLKKELQKVLGVNTKVAMEYSPDGNIPYVSLVDAGTIELLRSFGVEVVSSAGFIQYFTCVLSDEQKQSHFRAGKFLEETVNKAWDFIGRKISTSGQTSEYEVQQFIQAEFDANGFITDGDPICAVNANSSNPHYSPTKISSQPIKRGDFILIDIWCKEKHPSAIFADICKVAVARDQPTEKEKEIFSIVRNAQKQTSIFIQSAFEKNRTVLGYEADKIARDMIETAGYGPFFTHRTGHNIHTANHGPGTHLDSLETLDDRPIIKGTCFSVEPGIYLPDQFGVRLEFDMYVDIDGRCSIQGGEQEEIKIIK